LTFDGINAEDARRPPRNEGIRSGRGDFSLFLGVLGDLGVLCVVEVVP
jgi:hypothetical protein